MSTIGENIKNARLERGYTQKELAEKLNVSQNAVHNWENGKREPNIAILHNISKILDKSIILLIEGNEDKYPLSPKDYKTDLENSMNQQDKLYYLDPETAKKAQEIFENKELSLLFDAARDASPEDIQTVHTMLLALKNKEKHED